ncbi:MAG: RES family NAD+ phosphorylase [Isosphaeraceae bacterium]|nr:RES family NAD+ phosphorylase [Isosphaeraceae bacterium]
MLLKALDDCRVYDKVWQGDLFRVASIDRANEDDLISGQGSKLWGQRWNPPGLFRTVYFSLNVTTAVEEALAQSRRQGLPDSQALPLVLTSAFVKLTAIVDLSDVRVRSVLGAYLDRMLREPHDPGPESVSQAFGRIAFSQNYQGLLVPSAAVSGHFNLVIFPESLSPGQLRVTHADRLPSKAGKGPG